MKRMRSRFRLISLLLACIFLLTAVVCTGSVLKQAGISLPVVHQVLPVPESPAPEASLPDEKVVTSPPETAEDENLPEETTNQPNSEYNLFGL